MAVEEIDSRIAILLHSLGNNVVSDVLERIGSDRAIALEESIRSLEDSPPDEEETMEVLEEFSRFMEFALGHIEATEAAEAEADPQLESFVTSEDPFADLQLLRDYQIAGALRQETAPTIAIVLSQLTPDRVGEIMRQLPDEVRQDAFLRLQASPRMPQPLLTRVITSIVERASLLDPSAASDPSHLADEKTASLLRAMDRNTRTELLEALEASEPETAERVKSMLFLFEDLLMFTDKSVQKLLAEVETSMLAVALKRADPDITARITDNLSKRAKASLLEEIEYLDSVTEETETAARKSICEIFGKLDQRGDLEMKES